MQNTDDIVELKVMLAQQTVVLSGLAEDCKQIKDSLVPNGKARMNDVEKKLDDIGAKSNYMVAIGTLLLACVPFAPEIVGFLRGK